MKIKLSVNSDGVCNPSTSWIWAEYLNRFLRGFLVNVWYAAEATQLDGIVLRKRAAWRSSDLIVSRTQSPLLPQTTSNGVKKPFVSMFIFTVDSKKKKKCLSEGCLRGHIRSMNKSVRWIDVRFDVLDLCFTVHTYSGIMVICILADCDQCVRLTPQSAALQALPQSSPSVRCKSSTVHV